MGRARLDFITLTAFDMKVVFPLLGERQMQLYLLLG
jgi:hypothetical protein